MLVLMLMLVAEEQAFLVGGVDSLSLSALFVRASSRART